MKDKLCALLPLGLVAAVALPCGAITFTVTNALDSGAGSLRATITGANATPGGTNVIQFNIPPLDGTVKTITPITALPTLTRPVIIDGYTQPGASQNTLSNGDDAKPLIELNGAVLGNDGTGLVISGGGGGSTVRGLVIDNGWSIGILIATTNVAVEGCFLGTDPTGLIARPVGKGVDIDPPAASCRVGGTSLGQRNVISGNGTGVAILGGTNHLVAGNFIGTDATGTNARARMTKSARTRRTG